MLENMDPLIIVSLLLPLLVIVAVLAWRNPVIFLGVHIFSRSLLDGMSQFTYRDVLPGVSLMQVYSILSVVIIGIYLFWNLKARFKCIPFLLPIGAIILSVVLSGIVSNSWMPIFENSIKWVYLILFSGLIVQICMFHGTTSIVRAVWVGVLPAVFSQIYSIVTKDFSYTAAGHLSYTGGFYHNSMLSYFLLAFIATSIYLLIIEKKIIMRSIYLSSALYGNVAIYLCGYRTSFVALLISWLFIYIFIVKKLDVQRRVFMLSVLPFILFLFFILLGEDLAYKFKDMWILIKDPLEHFDFDGGARTSLFSGRIYIINQLMSLYLSSPLEAIMAGMGIDSSKEYIGTYSHNEFLSSLVETGIFGLMAFLVFVFFLIYSIYKSFSFMKVEEIPLFGMGIGLLVMTLATMPFRDMRAMIFFGVIIGVMHYKLYLEHLKSGQTQS